MKTLRKTKSADRRRQYQRRNFLRLERLEDRSVLSGASPVAVNDLFHSMIDTPLEVSAPAGVLANDSDAEGDTLSASLFSGPANGTLNLNADGSFVYTPNSGFTGTDSFIYYSSDGGGLSLLAAVTLQIDGQGAAPVSQNDSFSIAEDGVLNIGFSEGVLANDTDADGDPLTAALVSGPANGTLALNADGSFTYIPGADFNGSDSFTYTATDGAGVSSVATVSITVDPVNDLPTAANDAYSVAEDTEIPATESVLENDADPDGDSLSASLVSDALHGTLVLESDGTFTYLADENFNGLDGFSYLVSDAAGNSNVATVTITVEAVNDLPVTVNDEYSIDEDSPLTIAAPGVLGNDTDVEGDPLAAAVVAQPLNGTLAMNSDGSFVYTPNANFNGVDGFSYLASDGQGDSQVATVTITVNPVNDTPESVNDEYSTDEDAPLTIAAPGVLGNDIDVDGDPLSATVVNQPLHGTVTLSSDGSFVYTPEANFNGVDGFSYLAGDGTADSEVATVTITVNPVNDDPTGADDVYATDEDTALTIDAAAGVLANDLDADGDALTATLVSGPANGALTLNGDGSFSYTPSANFNGADSFVYTASDGTASTGDITVTINVSATNDAPVGAADSYTVDEDATLSIDAAAGLLANDSDVDGDPLAATVVSGPANGSLTLNADGSFSYTPTADFSGADTFTYSVSDGTLSSEATVTITVNPVNDAPVAVADAYDATEDTELTIDAALGVLANDTDADGDALTATLVTGPANGTLTLNADGSFVYTPNSGTNGSDSFTYSISDGTTTSEATATINVAAVNDAPAAAADAYTTDQDTALAIDAATGVLANDTDPDGDALSAILVSGPANGALTLNADGSFNYTPTAGFSGSDSFVYKANDGGLESEATVTITINPVETPEVADDAYSTGEDVPFTADASMGVLANDFDPEGGTLTAAVITGAAHGSLTLNADGSFSYTPEANWNGTDTFVYEVTSSTGGSMEATASIVVEPLNDAPTAVADEFDVLGSTLTDTVMGNDSDIDGDALTARLIRGPEHGELVFNDDGTFTYTADEGFTGEDCFRYQLNDGMANSGVVQVKLNVGELTPNTLPVSVEDAYTVVAGETLTVAAPGVLTNDTDAESDPLTAVIVDNATHGALAMNADGSFSYTPEAGFTGSDTFTYMANDGTGDGNVVTVTLTVTPEDAGTPIEAADDSYSVDAETVLTVDAAGGVLANDVDAEGDPLTVTVVDNPANGTVTLSADGSFVYTPNAGFSGSDTFTYTATDGTNVSNVATATIDVAAPVENTRPSAGNDSYTVESGAVLEVPADQGVLLDDSDPEGDAITASLFASPLHGTVTLNEDGSFTYTPEAGYVGLDSFIYRVFDGTLYSALAAVTIHITAADPGEVPPPGGDDCDDMSMSALIAMGEGEDDGLLDSLADPSLDSDTIDDVLADGSWLA